MRKILLLLMLVTIVLPVTAQIYSYTDSDGKIIYTSTPPPGVKADTVRLGESQKMTSPNKSLDRTPTPAQQTPESTPPITASRLYLDGIPDNEEAFRANNGTFNVTIKSEPDALASGFQFRLMIDGTPSQTQGSPTFTVANLERGAHVLIGEILKGGVPIAATEAKNFTVQRVNRPIPQARRR